VLGIQRLALERCPEAIDKLRELMRSAESERAQADAASKNEIYGEPLPNVRPTRKAVVVIALVRDAAEAACRAEEPWRAGQEPPRRTR
jgi:hypothetical protein